MKNYPKVIRYMTEMTDGSFTHDGYAVITEPVVVRTLNNALEVMPGEVMATFHGKPVEVASNEAHAYVRGFQEGYTGSKIKNALDAFDQPVSE